MIIPRELLQKYNQPVPRYTSYPPANYFKGGMSGQQVFERLEASNQDLPRNISLYFHVPFCRQMCLYCGCNSCRLPDQETIDKYFQSMEKEVALFAARLDKNRKVSQVHFGGGTPNSVSSSHLASIMENVHQTFGLIDRPEIAIECHPAYLDEQYIRELKKMGFNRFSLGIQDFHQEVLEKVRREPPKIPVARLIEHIRQGGGTAVNLDLMYGLPGQSLENFPENVHTALALQPDRLVTFSYAHVPWVKPMQKKLEEYQLPGAETKVSFFEAAYQLLTESGYVPIGLDHYAKPSDELSLALHERALHRNFQGYCTQRTTGQVYAFGISAITQLGKAYLQNTKDIGRYIDSIHQGKPAIEKGHVLSRQESICREIINQIMCNKYLSWPAMAKKFGVDASQLKQMTGYDEVRFHELGLDGLVDYDENEMKLTGMGKFFIRNIAGALDPGLYDANTRFSRSI